MKEGLKIAAIGLLLSFAAGAAPIFGAASADHSPLPGGAVSETVCKNSVNSDICRMGLGGGL